MFGRKTPTLRRNPEQRAARAKQRAEELPPGYVYRWLIAQLGAGSYEVQRHQVCLQPDGDWTLRIPRGRSVYLETIPAEKVYASQEAAEQRVLELSTETEPL
jgi:hypothetical protein